MTAGEWIPRNGTISTCSQFSTADPTTAPPTSPLIDMMVAFPAKIIKKESQNVIIGFLELKVWFSIDR